MLSAPCTFYQKSFKMFIYIKRLENSEQAKEISVRGLEVFTSNVI